MKDTVLKRIGLLDACEALAGNPEALPKRVVFILSTARTGTKAFAEGLAGEGLESHHQPPGSRILTCASNLWLEGLFPTKTLRALVRKVRLSQIEKAGATHYIQSFAFDHVAARLLHDAFENVRVLHVVRDPRTFVPSYLNWTHTRLKSYIANKLVPGWHPNGWLTNEFSWRQWRSMDEFQRVCWHWRFKNELLEAMFGESPRYMRLRFEDLMFGERRSETLISLLAFLDIPFDSRFESIFKTEKNVSKKTYFPKHAEWPIERKRQLIDLCGPLMARYGYATQEQDGRA